MRVIAVWAHIDGNLASVLTNCLKTDITTGAAMYQALTGGDAKRAVLLAAASTRLSPDDFAIFNAALRVIKPSRDRRNDFAHNIWAYSAQVPNALLLMHSSVVINQNVAWRQYIEDHKKPIEVRDGIVRHVLPWPPAYKLDDSKIQVFKEGDLIRDLEIAEKADDIVMWLWRITHNVGGYDEGRTLLLNEPRIAAILQQPTP